AGVTFLDTTDSWPDLGRPVVPVEIARPTLDEQRLAWAEALDSASAHHPDRLAGQFCLDLPVVRRIPRQVLAEAPDGDDALALQLWDACRNHTRTRLDSLAQRVDPRATWDDLVLPAAELSLLRQVAGQVRQRGTVYHAWGFGRRMNRGLGINALFSGE